MQTQADLSRAGWRKSSHSNNGGDCVEVAKLDRAAPEPTEVDQR